MNAKPPPSKRQRTQQSGVREQHQQSGKRNYETVYPEYTDYAATSPPLEALPARQRGGAQTTFPQKLYRMLSDADNGEIIRWQPHGRAFKVHDKERFVDRVLPKYFQYQTEYASFQRQLNIYQFYRLTKAGPDQNAYYHELFLRERRDLCSFLVRRSKDGQEWKNCVGRNVRKSIDPDTEPDLYRLPYLPMTAAAAAVGAVDAAAADKVESQPEQGAPDSNGMASFASSEMALLLSLTEGTTIVDAQAMATLPTTLPRLEQSQTDAMILSGTSDPHAQKLLLQRHPQESEMNGISMNQVVAGAKTTGLEDEDDACQAFITGSSEGSKTSSPPPFDSSSSSTGCNNVTGEQEDGRPHWMSSFFAATENRHKRRPHRPSLRARKKHSTAGGITSSSSDSDDQKMSPSQPHYHRSSNSQSSSSNNSEKRGSRPLDISFSNSDTALHWSRQEFAARDRQRRCGDAEISSTTPTSLSSGFSGRPDDPRLPRASHSPLRHQGSLSGSSVSSLPTSSVTAGMASSSSGDASDMVNFLDDVDFGSSSDSGSNSRICGHKAGTSSSSSDECNSDS